MTLIQGVLLGLTQGLTEFLPISSSGHLVMVQHWLNLSVPPVFFDVTVHLATALVIIIVLWQSILALNWGKIKLILIASLPAGLMGVILNSTIESLFNSLPLVGGALLVTAAFLFSTKFLIKKSKSLNTKSSLVVGLFQALAIIPGISRSGSTIVGGLWAGLSPKKAFEFSFLLSLPAILGAELLQVSQLNNLPRADIPSLAVGFITAFISGFFALSVLKKAVIKNQLYWFGFYCLLAGAWLLLS